MTTARRAVASLVVGGVLVACGGDAPGREDSAGTAQPGAAPRPDLSARRTVRCDAAAAPIVIDSAGIGPVLLGTRVAALTSRCTVVDTTVLMSEGARERGHVITVGNRPLLALSSGTPDTSIIRVITTDPAFRTSGGVGVGSSVQALRLAHGPLCAARGEGNFVVTAARLQGVSFGIDWNPPPSREPAAAETPFPGGDPGTALDASRVTRVWVHGVSGGCRVGVG